MNQRFISILLVFLLLASVSIPTVTAEPTPIAAAAAPAVAKLVVDGITIIVTSAVVIEIGKNIGKTWDETAENWDKFVKGVSTGLEKLFHAKEWIKVTSPKGQAVMRTVYECWNAGGSDGKKDNDKWYFEARKHDGKIEINPKALNEEQALKEMGRGKHIMTVRQKYAEKLINRFNNDPPDTKVLFEKHNRGKYGKEEFFEHANFEAKNQRCHVWVWEP